MEKFLKEFEKKLKKNYDLIQKYYYIMERILPTWKRENYIYQDILLKKAIEYFVDKIKKYYNIEKYNTISVVEENKDKKFFKEVYQIIQKFGPEIQKNLIRKYINKVRKFDDEIFIYYYQGLKEEIKGFKFSFKTFRLKENKFPFREFEIKNDFSLLKIIDYIKDDVEIIYQKVKRIDDIKEEINEEIIKIKEEFELIKKI